MKVNERIIITGMSLVFVGVLLVVTKNEIINESVVVAIVVGFALFLGFTKSSEFIIDVIKYFYK